MQAAPGLLRIHLQEPCTSFWTRPPDSTLQILQCLAPVASEGIRTRGPLVQLMQRVLRRPLPCKLQHPVSQGTRTSVLESRACLSAYSCHAGQKPQSQATTTGLRGCKLLASCPACTCSCLPRNTTGLATSPAMLLIKQVAAAQMMHEAACHMTMANHCWVPAARGRTWHRQSCWTCCGTQPQPRN